MRLAGRRTRLLAAPLLTLALVLAACDDSSDTDQQIAELEQQVSDLEAELETTSSALEETQDANAELEEELSETQAELTATQDELTSTQARLEDAEAQLAAVGEVVLEDGTYIGQVLDARQDPYRAIVFDAGGLWRVAQVADGATITAGGDDLTMSQFGRLLSSTDPDDVKLANGNYQVIVRDGLVTSIRKSSQ